MIFICDASGADAWNGWGSVNLQAARRGISFYLRLTPVFYILSITSGSFFTIFPDQNHTSICSLRSGIPAGSAIFPILLSAGMHPALKPILITITSDET